jgi:hypothetical protein
MVVGDEVPAWGVIRKVNCATWIRRRGGGANHLLVLYGRCGMATSPLILDLSAFNVRACALAYEPW